MATTWSPVTNFQKKQWLLTDGSVVTEPDIEESGSGRMIRFPGTDLKGYRSEHVSLLRAAVNRVAEARSERLPLPEQVKVWMRYDGMAEAHRGKVGFDPKDVKANLHVSTPGVDKTILWWVFRHPTLPIEATVVIRGMNHQVAAAMVAPDTDPHPAHGRTILQVHNHGFGPYIDPLNSDEQDILREYIRDNPAEWADVLGSRSFTNEHDMLKEMLRMVRHMEDFDTIQIPDSRRIAEGEPAWLDLELYDTNVNGSFIADLTDVLENGPSFEEAARMYEEFRTYVRKLGLVFDTKTPDSFQRALAGDEKEFYAPISMGGMLSEPDTHHKMFVHLPTGTFVVECDLRVDHNAVAAQWDEARTIASITGEEPALLAFARETARREQAERTDRIARERGAR